MIIKCLVTDCLTNTNMDFGLIHEIFTAVGADCLFATKVRYRMNMILKTVLLGSMFLLERELEDLELHLMKSN